MGVETLSWRDGRLFIIDQTLLPEECVNIPLDTVGSVWEAIKSLRVRGAPAIGICAAYGVVVGLKERWPADVPEARRQAETSIDYLGTSRPTAVNLFWALGRMRRVLDDDNYDGADDLIGALEAEAIAIHDEDRRLCRAIGARGADLIRDGDGVLTHCNAGGLATADYGTALAVMFTAHEQGRQFRVFADETRPLLQGARLTAWELAQRQVPVTLICDSMAAQVMREGRIQLVITGADRIAANGDTANKIGTYGVAILARAHGIPFYIAAPTSTIDASIEDGSRIPIEQRDAREITHGFNRQTAPDGIDVYNPAFDVTPAELIAGIITERGVLRPPFIESIRRCMARAAGRGGDAE